MRFMSSNWSTGVGEPTQREQRLLLESGSASRTDKASGWLFLTGVGTLSFLQCFDTVGRVTGRTSGLQKSCGTYLQRFSSRISEWETSQPRLTSKTTNNTEVVQFLLSNHTIVTDPTIRQPVLDLPRHTWSLLNRFRTGQGPCHANLHKWGLAQSPSCDCGQHQTMNHIVDTCSLTKFESTPRCGRWCSHMGGIHSDCSTHERKYPTPGCIKDAFHYCTHLHSRAQIH